VFRNVVNLRRVNPEDRRLKLLPCENYPKFRITWALFAVVSGPMVHLITHLHLMPKLRLCGAVPTLPPYVFMAWCLIVGTKLHLQFWFIPNGYKPKLNSPDTVSTAIPNLIEIRSQLWQMKDADTRTDTTFSLCVHFMRFVKRLETNISH
jgi:hypothetical protein